MDLGTKILIGIGLAGCAMWFVGATMQLLASG